MSRKDLEQVTDPLEHGDHVEEAGEDHDDRRQESRRPALEAKAHIVRERHRVHRPCERAQARRDPHPRGEREDDDGGGDEQPRRPVRVRLPGETDESCSCSSRSRRRRGRAPLLPSTVPPRSSPPVPSSRAGPRSRDARGPRRTRRGGLRRSSVSAARPWALRIPATEYLGYGSRDSRATRYLTRYRAA